MIIHLPCNSEYYSRCKRRHVLIETFHDFSGNIKHRTSFFGYPWHHGTVQECVWIHAVKADVRGTVTWAVNTLTPCDVIWYHGFGCIFIQAFSLFRLPRNRTYQANLPCPHDRPHGQWAKCVVGQCLRTIPGFSQLHVPPVDSCSAIGCT